MCRYAYATTLAIVAESMVGTDEPVSFQEPHAQRDAAVQAKIACRGHLPVCQPVEHKTMVKKVGSNRFLCHIMREGYGIPIWSECGQRGSQSACRGDLLSSLAKFSNYNVVL